MPDVLSSRALGRATLARQLLLARKKLEVVKAVEALGGLQAQLARPPFVSLWSRLAGFSRATLGQAIHARQLVRVTHVRATLHLVSARDHLRFRAALQPMFTAGMKAILKQRGELPMAELLAAARTALSARPQTFEDLRVALAKQFPALDDRAMGYAVRTHLPLVQVPDDSAWSYPGAAAFALADAWLGRAAGEDVAVDDLVLSYLAAFGPASVADAQRWSGLGGLRPVFERLRARLRSFRDERGRELFDLPGAPRPSEDVEAPVRFLPDFDSLVLAHDDRSRVVDEAHRGRLVTKNLRVLPTFLVDGMVAGLWDVEVQRGVARLTVSPFGKLGKAAKASVGEEGERLLAFVEPEARQRLVDFS